MKNLKYKLALGVFILGIFFLFYGCSDDSKKNDNADKTITVATEDEDHDDENQVSLTEQQIKTVGIELGYLERKELASAQKLNGFLRVPNTNKANATSMFGGIIKVLNIEIGDYVKKGQVIASISNPEFIQLQEEYLSIVSAIEFANQEVKRQNDLFEGNVGAKKNLQKATSELNTLKTRKSSLIKKIQLMGINPASLTNSNMKSVLLVTSPIDGTVSDVFAKIGSYVDVSFPIAEIIENSALHLDLQVFEKDIAMIKVGQKIDFVPTNVPNKSYTAKVYNIGSSFSDSSKTIAVHCKVVGDKTGLIDGMNVTGIINLGGVLSTAVPNEAIVNSEGKYYIFLLKENLEKPHVHKEGETHEVESLTFERIEIMIGTSELGFTAIMPVNEIHNKSKIVTKGAFFVNAKLTNAGDGHEH